MEGLNDIPFWDNWINGTAPPLKEQEMGAEYFPLSCKSYSGLSGRCWLHLYHNCENLAVHASTSPLQLLQDQQLKSSTKAVPRSCYSKRSNPSPVNTANTICNFYQLLGLWDMSSSLGHRNCHFQSGSIYRRMQKATADISVLGLRTLHKAGKNSWVPMDDPTQSCLWQLQDGPYQLSKEKELSSEASTQYAFNTAGFLTDWPCSHFFLRYGNCVKKPNSVFQGKNSSHWDTHITQESL